ncbi:trace amine-associated receptor 13c-like [Channa argus]|uniref:trace amine-associated receptor 13c-like n=1 Tax=Channa argus TaxID=215402 RepID=UPI0035214855
MLRRTKARKAAGPDFISSRLLKSFADQLCGIVQHMFGLVPVPKIYSPKDFGVYRPVVLTSHLMKTLEKLVLNHLHRLLRPSMNPIQLPTSQASSPLMESLEEAELCFPHLNTSCKKHFRPHFEAMLTYTLLSFISLFTVVLNLLVIISISHFRQLHTTTNLLLLSLAVSDFLVGLLVMPFRILLKEPCWMLGDLVCVLYYFLAFITVCTSVVNMVLISADRYVAICDPLHYSSKVTIKRVQVSVLLCWVYCVFYSFMLLYDNLKQPGRYNSCYGECVVNTPLLVDLVLTFIIPISAIIILYVRVFVVAVSQARAMRSHITAVTLQCSVTVTVKKSELKAARTLGVVVAVFLICYCPFYCVSLSGSELVIGSSTTTFFVLLIFFNSSLNPVIYAFFYPWFRKSVKLIVTLEILQPNSCGINVL